MIHNIYTIFTEQNELTIFITVMGDIFFVASFFFVHSPSLYCYFIRFIYFLCHFFSYAIIVVVQSKYTPSIASIVFFYMCARVDIIWTLKKNSVCVVIFSKFFSASWRVVRVYWMEQCFILNEKKNSFSHMKKNKRRRNKCIEWHEIDCWIDQPYQTLMLAIRYIPEQNLRINMENKQCS